MPEGPEVKIASDYFNQCFSKKEKIKFEILTDYYNDKYFDVFKIIENSLEKSHQTYTIGKNIFLDLNKNKVFTLHLGMTGGWSKENVKHCHFRVFSQKKELFFKDVRKFGKLRIITKSEQNKKFQEKLDLLNNAYDMKYHLDYQNEKISDKKPICSIIMDQKYFPGVGNYIKSETLYSSKIHPEEKWRKINLKSKINLIKNTQDIMQKSYAAGGAELKDFKNPFEKSEFRLQIYAKKHTTKKNPITSIVTSDYRKSWFCPIEQKLKK